jgi:hypothetical protein
MSPPPPAAALIVTVKQVGAPLLLVKLNVL